MNTKSNRKSELEQLVTNDRLAFHLENTPLGFIEWDNQLHLKSWSKRAEEIFGWTEEEFIALEKTAYSMVYTEDQPLVLKISQQLISGEVEGNKVQHRNYTKQGKVIWCEWFNSVQKDKKGEVTTIISLVQDITASKEAEEKINKANRLYAFISQVNHTIVHIKDERILFLNFCRIALEFGKFKMAWIGMFDKTKKKINLVHQSGMPEEDTRLFIDAIFPLNGPQDYVLRTGANYISNNIENEPNLEGWKVFAAKHNIRSILVLPVKKSGNIIGTFNLYATELNFSFKEEIELIVEVTEDISFALDILEQAKKQKDTEERLVQNEKRFRALIEKSADMKTLSTLDGVLIYGSPSITTVLGYSKEEYLNTHGFNFIHPDDIAAFMGKRMNILRAPGKSFYLQLRLLHKDGHWVWCEGTNTNMLDEPGINALVSNFRDISEKKRDDENLRRSESRLKEAQAIAHISNWEIDMVTNVHTWSDEFYNIYGITKDEVMPTAEAFLSFMHPDDAAFSQKKMLEAFQILEASSFNFRFIRKDGTMKYGYAEWRFEFDRNNKPIRLYGILQDVTEIKLAEREIKENNERYELAIIATNDVLWDWNILTDKIYRSENYKEQFGYTSSSENVYDDSWITHIHPEDKERTMKSMMDKVNNAAASTWEDEYRFYRSNGELAYIKDNGHIVRDETGEAIRMVGAMMDITRQKLSEEELLQEQKKLKEAQTIAHIGNWEYDFARNVHTWSDELYHIFGIKKEGALPSTEFFLSFMHPDDAVLIKAKVQEAFNTLNATSYNFRFIRADGAVRYGYTERKFEFDKNNKPIRLIGVVQDITERKLAEAEREKMIADIILRNKVLQQFAHIVSHNLRAPITNILGISKVMEINPSDIDREQIQQYLFDAVNQLDEIVKDLNKILQIRSDITENREPVYFPEIVNGIKSGIQNLIEKENVEIQTDFSAIDKITTLHSYIYNIFYNLVSNSIKFRQPGIAPVIKITSEIHKEKIRISFKDNGSGIDLKQHGENIFGLYKRFHSNIEGKGLGLFMVKTQVEVLGGNIIIKSEENAGTEFIIELPV